MRSPLPAFTRVACRRAPATDATRAHATVRSLLLMNALCVGGAERQTLALFNGLTGGGHISWLQCLKSDLTLRSQIDPARLPFVQDPLGVESGLDLRAVRELARRLDALEVDVVVCTNMYALLYASLARARCRRRAQVGVMAVFHTTDVGSLKERCSMVLYKRIVRSAADQLVFVCRAQAAHWHARGLRARSETVIHNGIDTGRFVNRWSDESVAALREPAGFRAEDRVFGLCAVMRPEKAHADFLAALALLRRQGIDAKGLLIGDGPLRPEVEARIRRLGLEAAVHITGYVDDVRPWIAACDAMVLTSHAVETFSIAALESMALGRPMVMTRIGGASEQVAHGVDGWLYPAGDLGALTDALARLVEPGVCREMGRKAAARVRQAFGLERMVADYRWTLEAVAARRRPAGADRVLTTR